MFPELHFLRLVFSVHTSSALTLYTTILFYYYRQDVKRTTNDSVYDTEFPNDLTEKKYESGLGPERLYYLPCVVVIGQVNSSFILYFFSTRFFKFEARRTSKCPAVGILLKKPPVSLS